MAKTRKTLTTELSKKSGVAEPDVNRVLDALGLTSVVRGSAKKIPLDSLRTGMKIVVKTIFP